jgi:predicted nucleic acid-binding protein
MVDNLLFFNCIYTPRIPKEPQKLDLLPRLFQKIHIVEEVSNECRAGHRIQVPDLVQLPWIEIINASPLVHSTRLLALDKGEQHTLDMAIKYHADWVVIDEKIGRNVAEYLGLKVVGTLGILLKAKQAGWIASFTENVLAMQAKGIFYHPGLIKRLAATAGE